MKKLAVGIALFALTANSHALPAQGADDAEIIPIDLLLEISSVVGGEAPVWSPDGSQILFSSGLGGGGLMTIDPEGGFPIRLPAELGGAGHFLAQQEPKWSPAGGWIAYISAKSGSPELWLWSVADGRDQQLTDLGGRINAFSWSPDGKSIAFAGDRYGNYDLWTVEVPAGEPHRLTADRLYETFPTWAPDSKHIIYVRMNEAWVDHDVLEIPAEGGEPRLIVSDEDLFDYGAGTKFGYPRVSPDGQTVLFRSLRSGWHNYWVVPRSGGEPKPIARAEADQSHARWSPDGRWIAYVENHNGTHSLKLVAASDGEPRALVAPDGMGVVSDPEWSPDGTRLSYTLETPTHPKDLYVVSVEEGQSRQLTHSMPAGNLENQLIVPEKVSYKSTDGLTVHAYLYKPPQIRPGEKYPGILWIHGGPTSQFNDTFQQHVQFFTQRGYTVLLPNIRGSSGYGKAFEDANNGCWGRCDLEDVGAGVEYLKTLSFVDAGKMGITGTSYGGCMSLAAVAFAPDLFQAAIPISGYGDWFHFYDEQELRHIKLLDYELGDPVANADVYRQSSPIFFVENVTTPTFLIHGEGHFPRSVASVNFAKALEKNYKVFRYEAYPNENYYVYRRDNRRQMLLDMLDFFGQFLKNGGAAAAATEVSP